MTLTACALRNTAVGAARLVAPVRRHRRGVSTQLTDFHGLLERGPANHVPPVRRTVTESTPVQVPSSRAPSLPGRRSAEPTRDRPLPRRDIRSAWIRSVAEVRLRNS